jgi:hypothetical protein
MCSATFGPVSVKPPSTTCTNTPPGTLYWIQIASPLLLPTGKKSTSNMRFSLLGGR